MKKKEPIVLQEKEVSKIIAMFVRNEMEDFHVKHLSDEQMKELNPIIRNAIYSTFMLLVKVQKGDRVATEQLDFLYKMIPSYWEEPVDVLKNKSATS